jgi:hypothetical protein
LSEAPAKTPVTSVILRFVHPLLVLRVAKATRKPFVLLTAKNPPRAFV